MIRTAILVDGGYYRKRARFLWGEKDYEKRASELFAYCRAHLIYDQKNNNVEHEDFRLYRVFYYDCAPVKGNVYHPLLKKQIRLEGTNTYDWMCGFLSKLTEQRKFALRLGELRTNNVGYSLGNNITKKLFAGEVSLAEINEDDFVFNAQQKGVDMRIGVDIASMAFKRQVDRMVLIAGDSDFVPAAKLARREGVDFILDPMHQKIREDLNEHIDGLRSPWKKKVQISKSPSTIK